MSSLFWDISAARRTQTQTAPSGRPWNGFRKLDSWQRASPTKACHFGRGAPKRASCPLPVPICVVPETTDNLSLPGRVSALRGRTVQQRAGRATAWQTSTPRTARGGQGRRHRPLHRPDPSLSGVPVAKQPSRPVAAPSDGAVLQTQRTASPFCSPQAGWVSSGAQCGGRGRTGRLGGLGQRKNGVLSGLEGRGRRAPRGPQGAAADRNQDANIYTGVLHLQGFKTYTGKKRLSQPSTVRV